MDLPLAAQLFIEILCFEMKRTFSSNSCYIKCQKMMPRSKAVLFSWKLTKEDEDTTQLAKVEVLLYRAGDIFDDRFRFIIEDDASLDTADGLTVVKLALAQGWMYEYKDGDIVSANKSKDSFMMRRVLLKQGTYVYLYRVNGVLRLNPDEKMTKLGTKRDVNFVDVKHDDEGCCGKDVCSQKLIERSTPINASLDNINAKIELFRAFSSIKDMYQLNLTVNGDTVSPLERSIWNRIEKEMAAKFSNFTE